MSLHTVLKQVFAKRNALKYYRISIIVQFIGGVKKHLNIVLILHVTLADTWDFFLREQKEVEERVRGRVCEREKERNRETDWQTDWEI